MSAPIPVRASHHRSWAGYARGIAFSRAGNIPQGERPYARGMQNQPQASGAPSPRFITEEERSLPLTTTELRAASRAMGFAYKTDCLPVSESNALISAHFKVKEALGDGGG